MWKSRALTVCPHTRAQARLHLRGASRSSNHGAWNLCMGQFSITAGQRNLWKGSRWNWSWNWSFGHVNLQTRCSDTTHGQLDLICREKKRWFGYLLSHVGPACGCKKNNCSLVSDGKWPPALDPNKSQHIGANATQCWVIEVNAGSCELGWMRAAEVSTAKSMVSPIFSSNSSRQIQNKSTSMSRRRDFSSGTLCHTVHMGW